MTKLIIIDAETTLDLTFEEVFERYQKLVKKEANGFHALRIEFEDKCQIAYIALWDTYKEYDISKGVGFGYVARFIIRNRFKRALKRENAMKRGSGEVMERLDRQLEGSSSDSSLLIDTIASNEDISMELSLRNLFVEFIDSLTMDQKKTLELTMRGINQKEIGIILDVGRQGINKRMKIIRKKFIQCMNMSEVV